MYKTIVFDLDGTLLNTLNDLTFSVNDALEQFHYPKRTLAEVKSFVGNGIRKLMERAVPRGLNDSEFELVFNRFKESYSIHCNDTTCLYSGVYEMLSALKRDGYKLAIVSNKADFGVKKLQKIYFDGLIDVAIGESEGIRKKPAPDTVFEALRLLNSNIEEAVYVGDSEVDIQTARNAGMDVISVLWGFRDKVFLETFFADYYVSSAEEILDIIKK